MSKDCPECVKPEQDCANRAHLGFPNRQCIGTWGRCKFYNTPTETKPTFSDAVAEAICDATCGKERVEPCIERPKCGMYKAIAPLILALHEQEVKPLVGLLLPGGRNKKRESGGEPNELTAKSSQAV